MHTSEARAAPPIREQCSEFSLWWMPSSKSTCGWTGSRASATSPMVRVVSRLEEVESIGAVRVEAVVPDIADPARDFRALNSLLNNGESDGDEFAALRFRPLK